MPAKRGRISKEDVCDRLSNPKMLVLNTYPTEQHNMNSVEDMFINICIKKSEISKKEQGRSWKGKLGWKC